MILMHVLSVSNSNKNCQSCIGPLPVKQGPDWDSGSDGGGVGCCGILEAGGRVNDEGGRHWRYSLPIIQFML